MARKVSGYVPGVDREYVPETFGNRDDKDPVRVWIKSPTERDRYALTCFGDVVKINRDDPSSYTVDRVELHNRHCAAVERCVVRVENYTDAAGSPIVGGHDLATHGDAEIVAEVGEEILSNLSLKDEQRKKSKGSQVSTSVATLALNGTAQIAEVAGSTVLEIAAGAQGASHTLPKGACCSVGVQKPG